MDDVFKYHNVMADNATFEWVVYNILLDKLAN